MEVFNLYALAEDRRVAREREARFERLRRRPSPAEPAPKQPRTGAGSVGGQAADARPENRGAFGTPGKVHHPASRPSSA